MWIREDLSGTKLPVVISSMIKGYILFGASLSEPHIDEFVVEFVYIYIYILLYISRTSCRKSHPTLILRILASFVNSNTIHKLPSRTQLSEKTPTV